MTRWVPGSRVAGISIQKRPHPEPDLRCEVEGVGVVAFEVTEAVDPTFARQLGDQQMFARVFREEYERLPQAKRLILEQRLGDATVQVEFHEDATVGRRRAVVPRVLDFRPALPSRRRHRGRWREWAAAPSRRQGSRTGARTDAARLAADGGGARPGPVAAGRAVRARAGPPSRRCSVAIVPGSRGSP